mmetsp:Transcript_14354/g.60479  ORF Transcript_14354/g.60479 Transcript_14354/m.60479 type:complete len:476 (+) Transcript_14354:1304-2731(+)
MRAAVHASPTCAHGGARRARDDAHAAGGARARGEEPPCARFRRGVRGARHPAPGASRGGQRDRSARRDRCVASARRDAHRAGRAPGFPSREPARREDAGGSRGARATRARAHGGGGDGDARLFFAPGGREARGGRVQACLRRGHSQRPRRVRARVRGLENDTFHERTRRGASVLPRAILVSRRARARRRDAETTQVAFGNSRVRSERAQFEKGFLLVRRFGRGGVPRGGVRGFVPENRGRFQTRAPRSSGAHARGRARGVPPRVGQLQFVSVPLPLGRLRREGQDTSGVPARHNVRARVRRAAPRRRARVAAEKKRKHRRGKSRRKKSRRLRGRREGSLSHRLGRDPYEPYIRICSIYRQRRCSERRVRLFRADARVGRDQEAADRFRRDASRESRKPEPGRRRLLRGARFGGAGADGGRGKSKGWARARAGGLGVSARVRRGVRVEEEVLQMRHREAGGGRARARRMTRRSRVE